MPSVSQPYPIAVAISDLHLSLTMPACRADKDWMAVQAGYLEQVKKIAYQQDERDMPDVPIICAGDIFDRWNAPPELINFALKHLPDGMLCIPGQHDLPLHRMDLMHRSGYGVLKQTEKIRDIPNQTTGNMGGFMVHGFGWDQEITPPTDTQMRHKSGFAHIAVIHRHVWTINHSFPGAPEDSHLNRFMKPLKGYDVAVFGDNHQGFIQELKTGTTVFNCGTFIRRKSDEISYEPSIGIIYSDGSVKRKKLDTSGDRFHKSVKDRPETPFDMKAFLDGLEGLGEHGLDFKAAVENHLKIEDVNPKVKEIILAAMESK